MNIYNSLAFWEFLWSPFRLSNSFLIVNIIVTTLSTQYFNRVMIVFIDGSSYWQQQYLVIFSSLHMHTSQRTVLKVQPKNLRSEGQVQLTALRHAGVVRCFIVSDSSSVDDDSTGQADEDQQFRHCTTNERKWRSYIPLWGTIPTLEAHRHSPSGFAGAFNL